MHPQVMLIPAEREAKGPRKQQDLLKTQYVFLYINVNNYLDQRSPIFLNVGPTKFKDYTFKWRWKCPFFQNIHGQSPKY